jgi:hypothetical protein
MRATLKGSNILATFIDQAEDKESLCFYSFSLAVIVIRHHEKAMVVACID